MSSGLDFRRLWTCEADSVLSNVYAANPCLRIPTLVLYKRRFTSEDSLSKMLLYGEEILSSIKATFSRPGVAPWRGAKTVGEHSMLIGIIPTAAGPSVPYGIARSKTIFK